MPMEGVGWTVVMKSRLNLPLCVSTLPRIMPVDRTRNSESE